jgi:hypothetical protein
LIFQSISHISKQSKQREEWEEVGGRRSNRPFQGGSRLVHHKDQEKDEARTQSCPVPKLATWIYLLHRRPDHPLPSQVVLSLKKRSKLFSGITFSF